MIGEDNITFRRIIKYIIDADSYTSDMSFADFRRDNKTISATAFVLSQIGEQAERISEDFQASNPQIDWNGIIGLKNQIAFDYDNVNLHIVWKAVHNSLPELERQIIELLTREPG